MTEFFGTGNHFCHVHGCHTNATDILVHGQELILERLETMAVTLAQVQADFAAYVTKAEKFRSDVTDAFARLEASVAANTLDPQALQDLDDAINADSADLDTADTTAVAEDPTPAPVEEVPAS